MENNERLGKQQWYHCSLDAKVLPSPELHFSGKLLFRKIFPLCEICSYFSFVYPIPNTSRIERPVYNAALICTRCPRPGCSHIYTVIANGRSAQRRASLCIGFYGGEGDLAGELSVFGCECVSLATQSFFTAYPHVEVCNALKASGFSTFLCPLLIQLPFYYLSRDHRRSSPELA